MRRIGGYSILLVEEQKSEITRITEMRKVLHFLKLTRRRKFLLVYALLLAIYTWLMFAYFKKYARFSNTEGKLGQEGTAFDVAQIALSKDIKWAILVVSKYFFLENACRHQALQAKILCDMYEIPYIIFVGFRKNEVGEIEGHAWTEVGGMQITGFCDSSTYHIHQRYTNMRESFFDKTAS